MIVQFFLKNQVDTMIYSRSAEYAIRAFVYLAALPAGECAMAKNIAAEANIPSHFLAKILQDLARDGFLKSSKGPHGGFRLNLPAEDVSMLRVIDAVDGPGRYDRCIGGSPECSQQATCGMHDSWMELRSKIMEYLAGTSMADLATAQVDKARSQARRRRPAVDVAAAEIRPAVTRPVPAANGRSVSARPAPVPVRQPIPPRVTVPSRAGKARI